MNTKPFKSYGKRVLDTVARVWYYYPSAAAARKAADDLNNGR